MGLKHIKDYFGADGYPEVTNEELKALDTKDRKELGEAAEAELKEGGKG